MQLDRIQIRLRQRSGWEALDLGRVMARAWAGPAYRAWAVTYLPCGLLLILVSRTWGPIVLWWLKPLFDRVLLFVYSRSVFGRPTSIRDLWREMPTLLRRTGLIAALTVYRLHPARSFVLPIWQLENQRGRAARARSRVLTPGVRGYAVWLTVACLVIDVVLTFSLVLLVEWLWPVGASSVFDFNAWIAGESEGWVYLVIMLLGMLAESFVEPLYVASGFSLYLNRRADLEAWDLELAFRGLAARRSHAISARGPGVTATLLAIALCLTAAPAMAGDQPNTMTSQRAEDAQTASTLSPSAVIREVLADPVFGKQVQRIEWRPRTRTPSTSGTPAWLKTLARIIEQIARSARVLVWIAGACALAAVLWWLIGQRSGWGRRTPGSAPPDLLFGLDVRPESLPADLVGAARALVAEGRVTEALSLLYRGTLVALIHGRGVEFRPGDTEDDCLSRARPSLAAPALTLLGSIVDSWQLAAYAHRPPAAPHVLSLADRWTKHFGPAGSPS